jgi:hypothetical protein
VYVDGEGVKRAGEPEGKQGTYCGSDFKRTDRSGEEGGETRRKDGFFSSHSVGGVLLAMTYRRTGEIEFGRAGQPSPRSTRLIQLRCARAGICSQVGR